MSTAHPRFTARIEGSPETIFDLLDDMPTYGRWLLRFRSVRRGDGRYRHIRSASARPISTRDQRASGPAASRYDRPQHIAFHRTMLLKKGPLTANIDVRLRYTLEPLERATCLTRDLDLTIQIPGLLKVPEPLVVCAFRRMSGHSPSSNVTSKRNRSNADRAAAAPSLRGLSVQRNRKLRLSLVCHD
jgi:hypothetical protein